MSDNKNVTGGSDRKRINVNEPYELQDWAKKFGVTTQRLKEAVEEAGTFADDVEAFLTKGK